MRITATAARDMLEDFLQKQERLGMNLVGDSISTPDGTHKLVFYFDDDATKIQGLHARLLSYSEAQDKPPGRFE